MKAVYSFFSFDAQVVLIPFESCVVCPKSTTQIKGFPMPKTKTAQPPNWCIILILFFFAIAILSEYFGKHCLAEIELKRIKKPDSIPQTTYNISHQEIAKPSGNINNKKRLNKKYYSNLKFIATKAKQYAQKHCLSENYCILVDYSLPSGTPRCFLWNFKNNKSEAEIHALHGSGGGSTPEKPVFSNKINSNCSSLGHYKITKRRGHTYPRGFYMRGLDKTNSNAEIRAIMIHPSTWVDQYKDYEYIPLGGSLGCVSITTEGIDILEPIILKDSKSLLLWAFTSSFPHTF